MQPCKFVFDDSPVFDGFAHGSRWNGWDNVAVTPAVHEQIIAWFKKEYGDEYDEETFNDLMPMDDGLISYGWGYTTKIVSLDCEAAFLHPDQSVDEHTVRLIPMKPEDEMARKKVEFADVLKELAKNDGACLYWQMENEVRAAAALEAGVIREEGELYVHPDAIEIEAEVAYTMTK